MVAQRRVDRGETPGHHSARRRDAAAPVALLQQLGVARRRSAAGGHGEQPRRQRPPARHADGAERRGPPPAPPRVGRARGSRAGAQRQPHVVGDLSGPTRGGAGGGGGRGPGGGGARHAALSSTRIPRRRRAPRARIGQGPRAAGRRPADLQGGSSRKWIATRPPRRRARRRHTRLPAGDCSSCSAGAYLRSGAAALLLPLGGRQRQPDQRRQRLAQAVDTAQAAGAVDPVPAG